MLNSNTLDKQTTTLELAAGHEESKHHQLDRQPSHDEITDHEKGSIQTDSSPALKKRTEAKIRLWLRIFNILCSIAIAGAMNYSVLACKELTQDLFMIPTYYILGLSCTATLLYFLLSLTYCDAHDDSERYLSTTYTTRDIIILYIIQPILLGTWIVGLVFALYSNKTMSGGEEIPDWMSSYDNAYNTVETKTDFWGWACSKENSRGEVCKALGAGNILVVVVVIVDVLVIVTYCRKR